MDKVKPMKRRGGCPTRSGGPCRVTVDNNRDSAACGVEEILLTNLHTQATGTDGLANKLADHSCKAPLKSRFPSRKITFSKNSHVPTPCSLSPSLSIFLSLSHSSSLTRYFSLSPPVNSASRTPRADARFLSYPSEPLHGLLPLVSNEKKG